MEIKDFSNKFINLAERININIDADEAELFYKYMNLLLEWNENINLTAITEPNEVILKHFIDSLTINKYIKSNSKVIDIGTGAGFPGLPLSIHRKDINAVLVDALNKRINFLNEICIKNNLKNVITKHARVEELAMDKNYRETFDYATSRAVASLNVLLEYMLPFVKVGGYCICMKGSNVVDEIESSKKALKVLGGEIDMIDKFLLPDSDIERNIIVIKKISNTPNIYPRKAGTPSKNPIK